MNLVFRTTYRKIAILMFVMSAFEPQYIINTGGILHYTFRVMYFISTGYMFYYCIRRFQTVLRSRMVWMIIVQFICFAVSTVAYGGVFSKTSISHIMDRLCLCVIWVFLFCQLQENETFLLKTMMIWGETILLANFVTILAFPDGIWQTNVSRVACWFLGHKNQIFEYYFLPFVCSMLYCAQNHRTTARPALMWILVCVSCIMTESKGALWTCVLLIIPLLCIGMKQNMQKLTWFPLAGGIAVNALVVFGRVQDFLFGEGVVSFTGRSNIWNGAMAFFERKSVLGYGGYVGNLNGLSGFYYLMSSHNGLLQLLLDGGILNLGIWMIFNVFAVLDLLSSKNYRMAWALSWVFFALYIHGVVEASFGGLNMYFLFILANHTAQNAQQNMSR